MTQKIPLIIDTDPGQDDAAAILMAFGLQNLGLIDLIAITTVAGNVPLNYTTENARMICDWANETRTPVYAGMEKPLIKSLVSAEEVHGQYGLDGILRHEPNTPLQRLHAVPFLVETLLNAPEKSITICAIGPLTNIAQALSLAPECKQGIKEIVIMGGCYFEAGNITPAAEFNFYVDPHAAKIVFDSGIPIVVLPLDVTHKARITQDRMQKLRELDNQNGARLADILQSYERYDTQKFGLDGAPLHDPCAVAYIAYPELFHSRICFVDIETSGRITEGASVVDWYGKLAQTENAKWTTALEEEAFFEALTAAIATLP